MNEPTAIPTTPSLYDLAIAAQRFAVLTANYLEYSEDPTAIEVVREAHATAWRLWWDLAGAFNEASAVSVAVATAKARMYAEGVAK